MHHYVIYTRETPSSMYTPRLSINNDAGCLSITTIKNKNDKDSSFPGLIVKSANTETPVLFFFRSFVSLSRRLKYRKMDLLFSGLTFFGGIALILCLLQHFLLFQRRREKETRHRKRQDIRPHPHRTRTRNASKWDLLIWMGVSTLHASNIKGFAFEFARARPVWIGPKIYDAKRKT